MESPPPLRELQRRLGRLISSRGLASRGDQADRPASSSGEPDAEAVALGVRGDGRLDAADRVGIYAGMYFVRLRDAIAEDYPALRAALGDAAFDLLLRDYVAAHPPSNPSLRRAADHLADFSARHPSTAERPWLPELARFEAALVDAFDAADEPILLPSSLTALPEEGWLELVVQPVRSLILLEPRAPVDELHAALLVDSTAADEASAIVSAAAPGPGPLRVWRQELRVYHRRIGRLEADALDCARGGLSFAALCAWVQERDGTEEPAQVVLDLLERWLADALLVDTLARDA